MKYIYLYRIKWVINIINFSNSGTQVTPKILNLVKFTQSIEMITSFSEFTYKNTLRPKNIDLNEIKTM